jgi:hypothetical protein
MRGFTPQYAIKRGQNGKLHSTSVNIATYSVNLTYKNAKMAGDINGKK